MTSSDTSTTATPPPQAGFNLFTPAQWSRPQRRIAFIAASVAGVILLVVILAWPRSITAHGQLIDETGTSQFSNGEQVVVESPSGTVIGTGTLTEDAKKERYVNSGYIPGVGLPGFRVFDFTVKVPSGQSRYGIVIGGLAPYWFSEAQMAAGPGITATG